jgi:hypothetical protein
MAENHPATTWQYDAGGGAVTLTGTCRGVIVNGAGDLYAIPESGTTEVQVASGCVPGTLYPIKATGIGASTTATLLTILY